MKYIPWWGWLVIVVILTIVSEWLMRLSDGKPGRMWKALYRTGKALSIFSWFATWLG